MKGTSLALLFAVLAGCASHRVRVDPTAFMAATADLGRADILVRQGCYVCLQEALSIYERLAQRSEATARAQLGAFETTLLLAARERELGLGSGTALDRARGLAAGLPAPYETTARLSMAESLPWKTTGVSREFVDEQFPLRRRAGLQGRAWRERLQAAPDDDLAARYLLLAFDCTNRYRLRDWTLERTSVTDKSPALLIFRDATCDGIEPDRLTALVDDQPRFIEAHLFTGELALREGRLVTAERRLTTALDGIPNLVAARLALGQVYQAMEDFELALQAFSAVVAAVPGHREGLLGKAIALGYTGRHLDAIPVLDEMVRLGTWYQGEAFYWRAWNRYRLREFDAADADAAEARLRLPMDPQVDKLTGLVALVKTDLDRAEREFRAAAEHLAGRGARDCDVGYYLASTLVARRKWPEAGPLFETAVSCYTMDEDALQTRIEEIRRSELGGERKARLVAAKERDITLLQSQQARSAYNAAVAYINAGDTEKCRPMAERAIRHPDFAAQARALLDKLK
ncbi:MAG: tetratricopeptide repeat protein [Acidobacteriota bacterium]